VLIATGCGDDDEGRTSAEAFCEGMCDAVARCGLQASGGSCQQQCVTSESSLSMMSHEGAKRLGDCLTGVDCRAFNDDTVWEDAWQSCWDAAKVGIPVTQEVRDACGRLTKSWFECGSLSSTSECETSLGMWSSSVVGELGHCSDSTTCDGLEACMKVAVSP
jgi:hypothetical protein